MKSPAIRHAPQKPSRSSGPKKPAHPAEIVVEITGACNQACTHCTSRCRDNTHLPLASLKKIVDEVAAWNVPVIRFTGGEPLLHQDIVPLLHYAKSKGLYVLMNTNATIMTPALIRVLGMTVDNILVSLQGATEKSEQAATRSPVTFTEKIRNIFLLRAHLKTLRLGTVLTPEVLKNLPAYLRLVKNLRADAWELYRPMNAPVRGSNVIPLKDYHRLIPMLEQLNRAGKEASIANAMPFCAFPDRDRAAKVMLGARPDDGHVRLVRSSRGFFKPSYFINEDLGNDLCNAWQHPLVKKIRRLSWLPAECTRCPHREKCCGGSRAQAYQATGDYFAPDPLFNAGKAGQP